MGPTTAIFSPAAMFNFSTAKAGLPMWVMTTFSKR
jgi:hypothetical protein